MKNGLYSVHIHMLDGVKGRDSGVLILHDGVFLGGGPYFWSTGSYTLGDGTWKGELRTNQHTPFTDDRAEVFGTTLVGTRSLSFHATLKRLAES